jgi:DNA-binding NarL/FixJ family response regulator
MAGAGTGAHAERAMPAVHIRVAVLDDHPAVLAGLQRLVEREADLRPVAFVETGDALRRALAGSPADVVVVDYDVARGSGLAVCQRLSERASPPRTIVYSAYAGPGLTVAARVAGVAGVVHKSAPVATLLSTIRAVAGGCEALPEVRPEVRRAALERVEEEDLAVASMLIEGASHDEIAATLGVATREISWRAHRIVARMRPRLSSSGTGSGTQGVRWAFP